MTIQYFKSWRLLIFVAAILCYLLIKQNYMFLLPERVILISETATGSERKSDVFNSTISAMESTSVKEINNKKEEDEIEKCNFPKLNPWDPSLGVECPIERSCKQIQPYLTYVDQNGNLALNDSAVNETLANGGVNATSLRCSYSFLDMPFNISDDEIVYDEPLPLIHPVQFKTDMVHVNCTVDFDDESLLKNSYLNLHAFPANFSQRIKEKPSDSRLSVLMLGLDSVSFSELRRYMPSTYEYVRETMGMFMFRKINKVGENSYPNLMAMLLGGRDGKPEKTILLKKERFDSVPLLFKKFAQANYTTVFNEDFTDWGFFHYGAQGFTQKPFDFYYRPFWLATVRKPMSEVCGRYCLANVPTSETHLAITRNHVMRMNEALQFVLAFYTAYTHNFNNDAGALDLLYRSFFEEMFENGYFNKTVVIFFSDHGHRFHKRRKSLVGALEEHNPMLGIWFPEWFYKLHPKLKRNLSTNLNRYSSTYDLHETLTDILQQNYEGEQKKHKWPGRSQLHELPRDRSCQEAGVPENYCLCSDEEAIKLNYDSIDVFQRLSETVTSHLNGRLAPLKLCRTIEAQSIVRASTINLAPASKSKDPAIRLKNAHKIRLVIRTHPNDAIFEALLHKKTSTVTGWTVFGEIERINAYGNSSACITDTILRKYCTC